MPNAPTQPGVADTATVGIVGLGLVGNALAMRLAASAYRCVGFDLRPEANAAFAQQGHEVASSLAGLAALVSTVVLAVFDTGDVVDAVEGPSGLFSGQGSCKVTCLIDCSTGSPALLEPLAARLATRGLDFIEAPLSGSSHQIAQGEATMLLGGDAPAIARAGALLHAIAPLHFHVGGAGMGARAKLATNLVLGLNRAVLAEGLAFAQSLGITPGDFLQLVQNSPARSDAALVKGDLMVQLLGGASVPAQSRIRQHLKDVLLMLQEAGKSGQSLPLSETHARLMQDAVRAGDGDLDNAAIVRRWRRPAR